MPRRYPDYPDAMARLELRLVDRRLHLLRLDHLLAGLRRVRHACCAGRKVGANYWGEGATTLEWTVPSPPPFHTFEELPHISPTAHH